jgi:hypothetical protein
MMMFRKAALGAAFFVVASGIPAPVMAQTTVNTTNDLLALSATTSTSVTRLGYYSLGDVAPLSYVSSTSPCPDHAVVQATIAADASSVTTGHVMTVTTVTSGSVPLNGFASGSGILAGTRVSTVPIGAGVGTYRLSQAAAATASAVTVTISGDGGSQIPAAMDGGCFLAYKTGSTGHPPAYNTFPSTAVDPAQFGAVADYTPVTWAITTTMGSNVVSTPTALSVSNIGKIMTIPNGGSGYSPFASVIISARALPNQVTLADNLQVSLSSAMGANQNVTYGTDNNAAIQAALNTGLNVQLGTGSYYVCRTLSMTVPGQRFNGASPNQSGAGTDLEACGDGASPLVLLANGDHQDFGQLSLSTANRIGTIGYDDGVAVQSYGHQGTKIHDLSIHEAFRPLLLDTNNTEVLENIDNENITGDYGIKVMGSAIPGATISSMTWSSTNGGQIAVVAGGTASVLSTSTYNSTTGVVRLMLSSNAIISQGVIFTLTGMSGTGNFAALNGTWTATTVTASGANETVTFTGPTGLLLTISGGTATNSNPALAGVPGDFVNVNNVTNPGTGTSNVANGNFQVISKIDANHFTLAAPAATGVFGTLTMPGGATLGNTGGYQTVIGHGNMENGAGTTFTHQAGATDMGLTVIQMTDTTGVVPGQFVVNSSIPNGAQVVSVVPNTSVTIYPATTAAIAAGANIEFVPHTAGFWASTNANSMGFDLLHSQGNCGALKFYDPTGNKPASEFQAERAGGDNQFCTVLDDEDATAVRIDHLYVNVHADLGDTAGPGVYMGPAAHTLTLDHPFVFGAWKNCIELAGTTVTITDASVGQCSDASGSNASQYAAIKFDGSFSGRAVVSGGVVGQVNTTFGGGRNCIGTDTTDPTLILVQGVQCQNNFLGAYDDPTNYTLGVNGDGTNPSNTPQSAPALNPWTRYLFRNLNNSYTTAHIALIDATYKALLSNGLFGKADLLYFATGSLNDSLINWRYPGTGQVRAFKPVGSVINFAEIGSVTPHVGGLIAGNATSYIDTGFPMSAALHCQTTSCSLFVYSTTAPGMTDNTPDITSITNSATSIIARNSGGSLQFTPNSTITYTNTVTNAAGLFGWVLSGTTANAYQGSLVLAPAHTISHPYTLTSGDLGLLGNGTNANTVRQDAFFGVFDGTLTGTDVANLSMIVSNFVNSW